MYIMAVLTHPETRFMTGFFTQIEDTDDVRQGDIIRKLNSNNYRSEGEGVKILLRSDADIDPLQLGGNAL